MHLRSVTPEDFFYTASMSVDAFWNDELYVYTNARRGQYRNHFRDSFVRKHRMRYWTPGSVFQVAVTDEGDDGHTKGGKVVGFATWERRGTSDVAKSWQKDTCWGCKPVA